MKIDNSTDRINNIKESVKQRNYNNVKADKQEASESRVIRDKVEIHSADKRLNEFNVKLKEIQANISEKQAYLSSLNKAKNLLFKNKDVETLYVELIQAAQKLKFNKKPLLKNIIPNSREFYKSVKNINALKDRINNEIKNISNQLNLAKKDMSKTLVSIENVNASFSNEEIGKIKDMLGKGTLFNQMNKDSIIALVK